MDVQYYGFTILLIWLQLAGFSAALAPRFGSWALGRSCGVLLVVMTGFLIEHFVGLGSLKAVWLFGSALSAWYIWKKWPTLRVSGFVMGELVFSLALVYGLTWKYCFPNIYPTAERLTDLYFIGNYFSGATLPPVDHWFPPYRFDFYYSLQHYGAALMGRVFNLSPGLTCNLAFIFLMALPITLAWDVAGRFISRRSIRLLLVATLVIGATGASVVGHFIVAPPDNPTPQGMQNFRTARVWGSARLIGYYERAGNTAFADEWFPKMSAQDPNLRELPLENYGYQFFVGDYHPPIGGFFLLLLAIGLIMALEAPRKHENGAMAVNQQIILALTVPATFAANTWTYPLQMAMVVSWAVWRHWQARTEPSRAPSWKALLGGGIVGFALIYPFLVGFAMRTEPIPFRINDLRTPLIPYIALMWPLLVMLGLVIFRAAKERPAAFFAILIIALLVFTEFVYVDDPTSGKFERGNSATKWWGWLWTGGIVALGAPLLGTKRKWVRWVTIIVLGSITSVYTYDTARFFLSEKKFYIGALSGDSVYTSKPAVRDMFHYLADAPDGIVLENLYSDAYNDGAVYAAFAAKPSLLGWPAHEMTWRGKDVQEISERRDQIRSFYAGAMSNPADWLKLHDVRYVVWKEQDIKRMLDSNTPDVWVRLNTALESSYAWHKFGGPQWGYAIGLWVRRDK